MMSVSERNTGIDCMRLAASFSVVVSHWMNWFGFYQNDGYRVSYFLLGNLVHFAVPFFFLTSGYFLNQSVSSGRKERDIVLKYASRLLPLLVFWGVLYNVLAYVGVRTVLRGQFRMLATHWRRLLETASAHPFSFLTTWETPHLWFLSYLLLAVVWVLAVSRAKMEKTLLWSGIIFYIFFLVFEPYKFFFPWKNPAPSLPLEFCISAFFVSLGFWIREHQIRLDRRAAVSLALFGLLLKISESLFFWKALDVVNRQVYLLGTPFLSLGLFFLALSLPSWGAGTIFPKLGKLAVGVYALHVLVGLQVHKLSFFSHPTAIPVRGPTVIYLLTLGLVYLLSRIPFVKRYVYSA